MRIMKVVVEEQKMSENDSKPDLDYHIREYLDVMKDEPDEWIKVSQIYHDLKRMLGDED